MAFSQVDQRHLESVVGYIGLGMIDEALEEVHAISDSQKKEPPILSVLLAIYQQAHRWKEASEIAQQLVSIQSDNPNWFIAWAYSTRRFDSIEAAQLILLNGLEKHPDHAMINFNLGCYAAQLGNDKQAMLFVRNAVKIDPSYRKIAESDPDLDPIRDQVKELFF